MSTSTAQKVSSVASEVLTDAVRNRRSTATNASQKAKEQNTPFANIEANPFYSIMFNEEAKPEEKKEAVAKALTFSGTKEEMRSRIKEFETFKEYLQHVREEMAQHIIKLTDTDAFSELKSVYDEMNTSLLDFNERMKPLTDIIDAIYTLRTNGQTFDAFREIQEDRKKEEELAVKIDGIDIELDRLSFEGRDIDLAILSLENERSFFGLGGIKESARKAIAEKQYRLKQIEEKRSELIAERANLLEERRVLLSADREFAAEKRRLRELLDISTDEHKDRQKALVDAALHFVNTAKDRVGSVRDHLGQMGTQIENLEDANSNMSRVYAIMNEGIKEAEKSNQSIRETLAPPEGEEDLITKMTREDKKAAVEDHLKLLDASALDTMTTYSDLTSQTIRIKTMKEATEGQVQKARHMHTQGIAGVADRLATVLQAVSQAALGESSAIAKDTLAEMARNTNTIAQKESIRLAMGMTETNSDLDKALQDLAAYGEVQRAATEITRDAVSEMRSKLDELQQLAKGVQEDISEAVAVHADVGVGTSKTTSTKTAAKSKSPFNI